MFLMFHFWVAKIKDPNVKKCSRFVFYISMEISEEETGSREKWLHVKTLNRKYCFVQKSLSNI